MIIDKYFSFLRNLSCHYVEKFEKIFYLNLIHNVLQPHVLYRHILLHCACSFLRSGGLVCLANLGGSVCLANLEGSCLPSKSGRLMASGGSLLVLHVNIFVNFLFQRSEEKNMICCK